MTDDISTASSGEPAKLDVELLKKMLIDLGTIYDLRKIDNPEVLYYAEIGEMKGLVEKISERNGKIWFKLWSPEQWGEQWLIVTDDTKIYAFEVKKPTFEIRADDVFEMPKNDMIWRNRFFMWKGLL